jgi:phospholipid/cholesterol/gamma-HCH transport system substrate-binding protein
MSLRKLERSVGAFVLAGLVAVTLFVLESGAGKFLPVPTYGVTAQFANVGGLKTGSPVFIAGVSVGQVASITLNEQFTAIVELRLPSGVKLPADTMASIRTTGLIGSKIVTLLPGSDERMISEGDVIVDTESSVDIETLISRFAFGEAKAPEGGK